MLLNNSKNKMSLRILFISFLVCIFTGCKMTTTKDFSFSLPKINFGKGSIQAHLRGTWKKLDKNTEVRKEPYELLLWISIPYDESLLNHTVIFKGISLKEKDKNIPYLVFDDDSVPFYKKYDGTLTAGVNFKNLNLKHKDYVLNFSYSISDDASPQYLTPVTMVFKKTYNENKLSFWDILMGI